MSHCSNVQTNNMTNQNNTAEPVSTGPAKSTYILYLVSILIGITAVVGVIIAYIYRDDGPDWLKTHYRFQIRTFWIGALYLFVGVFFSQFIIGWFILMFWLLWLIVRCARGYKYVDGGEAHPNPTGWLF